MCGHPRRCYSMIQTSLRANLITASELSRILRKHQGPFFSIRLVCTGFGFFIGHLLLWLRILADKRVNDLVLVNHSVPFDLALPMEILTCCSLTRLWIAFFRFPSTRDHLGKFLDLKELGLCCIQIDEPDLVHMLHSSPALEVLAVVASPGNPEHINVSGHSYLRCVLLWLVDAVELSVANAAAMERLVLWEASPIPGRSILRVKIADAPKLRVLGYLEPMKHQLQIGNTIIKAGTKASRSTVVPSVEVLALKVCFSDKSQSRLLLAFLRCFPNLCTMHIESVESDEPVGKMNLATWMKEAGTIECFSRSLKNIYFHEFRGDHDESVFLKFIAAEAPKLDKLVITLSPQCLGDTAEIHNKLVEVGRVKWASRNPQMLVNKFGGNFSFQKASNLNLSDPFFCMDNLFVPPADD